MSARPLDLDLRRFTRPLGGGTHLTVWVALALLIPFLRKLISDKDTPEVDTLQPVVQPH